MPYRPSTVPLWRSQLNKSTVGGNESTVGGPFGPLDGGVGLDF
ncbi:hypothetical protein [Nocardia sp. 348MFTsu5.1]|nr:hypothetical protein [Nocardia sp. 348MFTsu5.1]